MDIQPATNQASKPISDDQELAKVLAGISKDTNMDLSFDDTPGQPRTMSPVTPNPSPQLTAPAPAAPASPSISPLSIAPIDNGAQPTDGPANAQTVIPEPAGFTFDESMMPQMPTAGGSLENIRKDALMELRPLVDKLDLAPEEKFDIYLLLLRSTDDTALIAPAHEAAKKIADESKRAEALLNVIKEIDFLSTSNIGIAEKPTI